MYYHYARGISVAGISATPWLFRYAIERKHYLLKTKVLFGSKTSSIRPTVRNEEMNFIHQLNNGTTIKNYFLLKIFQPVILQY